MLGPRPTCSSVASQADTGQGGNPFRVVSITPARPSAVKELPGQGCDRENRLKVARAEFARGCLVRFAHGIFQLGAPKPSHLVTQTALRTQKSPPQMTGVAFTALRNARRAPGTLRRMPHRVTRAATKVAGIANRSAVFQILDTGRGVREAVQAIPDTR